MHAISAVHRRWRLAHPARRRCFVRGAHSNAWAAAGTGKLGAAVGGSGRGKGGSSGGGGCVRSRQQGRHPGHAQVETPILDRNSKFKGVRTHGAVRPT